MLLADENGNYPPLRISSETSLSGYAIGGMTVGVVAVVLFLSGCLYIRVYKKKNAETSSIVLQNAQVQVQVQVQYTPVQSITIKKSVEFSYEELSTATCNFSLANKIGQGGFGAVYYAELRGKKAAIKKMDRQASREFLAELKAGHVGWEMGQIIHGYVQYGDVSPKVDVFAFGVVLYELISAKEAIIRSNEPDAEPKGLVALFDEVLSQADPKEDLVKMIDPRLGDKYTLYSVYKMAQLAKVCTCEDPQRRPSMRSIGIALMSLLSSTED
ncbi:hypothetical protein M8C21_013767 [Ambrosia artemisiifolia]|uniref:Protein kinase domain-containing protein n=1 Tax=Ambrosia artemisiifolia TaxID=4212 RepID=A0AAD5CCG6_AMBAR|nr:hypothetical protein M8C21_013767 [Ambrosia artemisiifolia]